MNALCIATNRDGQSCRQPAREGDRLCYFHAARAALGVTHYSKQHQRRVCEAVCWGLRHPHEPCQSYVAYSIPDADYHNYCVIHYLAHLRSLDRKPSEGCGCQRVPQTQRRRRRE